VIPVRAQDILAEVLYLDTSAALRAILERGTTPRIEERIRSARALITSRLSQVEAARALYRLQSLSRVRETELADARRQLDALWARCELWELTRSVCDLACQIAPAKPLRSLDALHLATYIIARRKIAGLVLLTADERLQGAAETV
jgi:predicted nucleic acid-binding protein